MTALYHPQSHATTSQTVGPYLHIGLAPRNRADIAFDGRTDQTHRIVIEGLVLDGDGDMLPDGMIEIWQADAVGVYTHPHDLRSRLDETARSASGFGRLPTEPEGRFRFTTVKPGRVPAPDGSLQAPHLIVAFFARGLLKHLSTRLYFADEAEANAEDFVLRSVPEARRGTLVAERVADDLYRWTLRLQGAADDETVFFAF
ncbi:MAG: protocatechuate 3,4-dioxygenase subunit alpha [Burkholderiaceae bacterium]